MDDVGVVCCSLPGPMYVHVQPQVAVVIRASNVVSRTIMAKLAVKDDHLPPLYVHNSPLLKRRAVAERTVRKRKEGQQAAFALCKILVGPLFRNSFPCAGRDTNST